MSLPLKFTNASVKRIHFTFLLHEFRSRFSKQVISVSDKKKFRNICRVRESGKVRCSQKPVDVLRENLLYRKTFLDSAYFCLKTKRQVSLYLSDREMNCTSSFDVQSNKLATSPHLLLTVLKPPEHEIAHRLSPSPAESLVDAVLGWWKTGV